MRISFKVPFTGIESYLTVKEKNVAKKGKSRDKKKKKKQPEVSKRKKGQKRRKRK